MNASTVFKPATRDLGVIKTLGHVTLREAKIGDIWPYMQEAGSNSAEFSLRVLAASLLIDGTPITYEQLMGMGIKSMRALQGLLPEVMAVNGMGQGGAAPADLADEGDEEAGPLPEADSAPPTGS